MKYEKVREAIFLERPNRFIAFCEIEGKREKVHVKNTGRCKELLVPGAKVYLEESMNPQRKTKYTLIAVQKGRRLINMDSQAPNQVVYEALNAGRVYLPDLEKILKVIKREKVYGTSRFDFYLETQSEKAFIEVKGVTLEEENHVLFPDAPTERGVKHIRELMDAYRVGYKCYILFVIQMSEVAYFTPHTARHPEFAACLKEAEALGVKILAYDCKVEPTSLSLGKPIKVILDDV
ncbi:DNA/RNA nuclease SfsA [Sporanaerobium hydrogeniformans]|uniref:DNA/RNA nuclease SfsA n=1 Tax=Sporanaerobium hydrogeniformans TaxID=3072179 RepID=A0AC61DFW4_9FIRM|nr:DNA/RNA nuclease SfsA [Sporanaerobium hydrogeniformans]PHV71678.1 DNA/RNA nuclease SfsA [Sporanaerobium hydrogeniformans]